MPTKNDDNELMLDVGQANELKLGLRRAGFNNADIKAMSEGDRLAQILPFVRGYAEIKIVEHVIDCDAVPFCPEGWTILLEEEQIVTRVRGAFKWDKEKQVEALYLSEKQTKGDKYIKGDELRDEIDGRCVLPANILDYLLKNPVLIPEEWKGKSVFFWGTIYSRSDSNLYVRCLCWHGNRWNADCRWLGRHFRSHHNPAVLSASQH